MKCSVDDMIATVGGAIGKSRVVGQCEGFFGHEADNEFGDEENDADQCGHCQFAKDACSS